MLFHDKSLAAKLHIYGTVSCPVIGRNLSRGGGILNALKISQILKYVKVGISLQTPIP